MEKTYTPSHNKIEQKWHLIDADGQILGKVASEAAAILIGKNKAIFTSNINAGDKVVIINAKKVAVSGNKLKNKVYHRLTGFPGGLRSITLGKLMEKKPTEALRHAINGMLPVNKLRKQRMNNLYIYGDENHPHQGQTGK